MGCGALVPVKAVNSGHAPGKKDPNKVMKGEYTQLQEARLVREKSMRDRRFKILRAADEKAEKALEEREHLSLGNRSRGTSRATSRTTSPTPGKKKQVLFKPPDEKLKPVEEKYKSQESLRIEDTQSNREKKSDKSSIRKTNSFKEQVLDSKMELDFSEINSRSSPSKDMPKNSIPNGLNISGTNSSLEQKESNARVKGVTDSTSRALTQAQNSDTLKKEIDISHNDLENMSHVSKEKKKKKSRRKDADDKVGENIAAGPRDVDSLEKGSHNHKNKKKRKKKKDKGQEQMIDDSVESDIQTVARDEDRAHSRSSVRSDASNKRG
ncbi:hypothetical protein CHS0354_040481 [Potamilus streckersoni]|uniref:Uncharacterized protein n=1 Tax=Potamilus streckersoni TaxID=2493646 RepID=A0AAE0TK09_9BIVA|nr:hypothetical protein CHS0354_040481 [Potamilus streckersoni]